MIEAGAIEELPRRAADLAILCEIGEVLNSSVELDEVLNMILIGVTAGQALRFNRAFLLLVDERDRLLKGSHAIGPDDAEEAARVWRELEHRRLGLREMLLTYRGDAPGVGRRVRSIVASLRVPLDDASHPFVRALDGGRARIVSHDGDGDPSSEQVARALGVDRYALVPISSRGGPVGVLLADNAITGRAIEPIDLHILRLFANHAGTAIEKARLYAKIREENKALEQAHRDLRRNQQTIIGLQRLSDLGEMAARIAHEIRNPLVTIGGFARRMLATTEPDDPRRRQLSIIASEVTRLEGILLEVLEYARPLQLNAVTVSLNELVRQMVETLAPEFEATGVELVAELDGACGPITADADLLRMALDNLLRNALQAIPKESGRHGKVVARTRSAGSVAEISVEDNGTGVPPEVADRVFQPFFTTKPSGSGLGLAIVSHIAREHGGRVRFENHPGKGAAFFLDVPWERGVAS